MPIHVKFEVRNEKNELMDQHSTYTEHEFNTIEEAKEWIENDSDWFVDSCLIDTDQIDEVISDDLVIVEINGFPVTEEKVVE